MIYREINASDFVHNVVLRESFTYQAAQELFDFYDQDDDCIRFDPVAIRCDWWEYNEPELFRDFGYLIESDLESEFWLYILLQRLQERTTIIKINEPRNQRFLVMAF
jgi:hypothetical protein